MNSKSELFRVGEEQPEILLLYLEEHTVISVFSCFRDVSRKINGYHTRGQQWGQQSSIRILGVEDFRIEKMLYTTDHLRFSSDPERTRMLL